MARLNNNTPGAALSGLPSRTATIVERWQSRGEALYAYHPATRRRKRPRRQQRNPRPGTAFGGTIAGFDDH